MIIFLLLADRTVVYSTLHCSYVRILLPELYAYTHPNFFKFHVLTSVLARTLFMCSLPLSGTHCLIAFASVNFPETP